MTTKGVVDALLELHEAAMSKDPREAAQGRIGKVFFNATNCVLDDEAERGTEPAIVVVCTATAMISSLMTAVATTIPPVAWERIGEANRAHLIKCFDEVQATMMAVYREKIASKERKA
jgi:hypothetical protein